jgi:hypothetical protein
VGRLPISDLRRYYKTSCAPKQDTAVLAVSFRRQQQAAFVGQKFITNLNDTRGADSVQGGTREIANQQSFSKSMHAI